MKLLLDTHVFLWWVSDAAELSDAARTAISDPGNTCYLSLASCWELAIKSCIGKLKLKKPVEGGELVVILPDHRELAEGTLASVLRQASLSREELERLL